MVKDEYRFLSNMGYPIRKAKAARNTTRTQPSRQSEEKPHRKVKDIDILANTERLYWLLLAEEGKRRLHWKRIRPAARCFTQDQAGAVIATV